MGSDTLIGILEIERDREPNWTRAYEVVLELSEQELKDAFAEKVTLEEIMPQNSLREKLTCIVDSMRLGWDGMDTNLVHMELGASGILIAADRSNGDPVEEIEMMEVFVRAGCARSAGFIVDDSRMACWLPREVAQQIVDLHAVYIEHGEHEPSGLEGRISWAEAHQSMEDDLVPYMVDVANALEEAGFKAQPLSSDEDDEEEDDNG